MILQMGEVFYTRSVARFSGTHSKSLILQMGEVLYTRSVARFSGTHSKSMILQMGEVLIYESNWNCEKNRGMRYNRVKCDKAL